MQLVTINDLKKMLKVDARHIYRLVKLNKFPQPLAVSPRKFRWLLTDIENWLMYIKNNGFGVYK